MHYSFTNQFLETHFLAQQVQSLLKQGSADPSITFESIQVSP